MMKNIKWYNINQEGYLIDNQNRVIWLSSQKSGIYIYKYLYDNSIYIGSSIDLKRRFKQHRHRTIMFQKRVDYQHNLFYYYVTRYGWNNFQYGILESINLNSDITLLDKKNILFPIEQKYLDQLNPSLNVSKKAGSVFGLKHNEKTKLNLKLLHTGKCYKKVNGTIIRPNTNKETLLKLKLHSKVKIVSIFTKDKELIKEFKTIADTARYVGLSHSSLSTYIKTGKLWNNLYYFKLKVNCINKETINFPLECFDENSITNINNTSIYKKSNAYIFEVWHNNKTIYKFGSITKASKYLNISRLTLTKYAMNNKLWQDKYEFKIIP